MDRQQEEQFREFALARWPTLLRTAILLSSNQRRAELLVQRTLVLVHRDWEHSDRRAAPEAWARSVLVRLSLDRPLPDGPGNPDDPAQHPRHPDGASAVTAPTRLAPTETTHTGTAPTKAAPTPPTGPAPADAPPDAGRSIHQAARSERLAAAVVALPPRVRAALVLRLFDELSEGDTALALRCPVPAVSGLVSEGLSRLEVAVAPERRGEEHRQ